MHLALYREFRPKTFDEVIAQHHIVETLKNQIESETISHAYLFCGTRGTGKTSCAKIFAKAVNCLHPINGSPCGECEVCKNIDANGNLDILEIDAASNNRVDEIRDLREKVNYLPSVGKYKVYIIDEVHMLTDSAFNALLKTLEEPPSHIIFILATTEPEKLPATILSRCMRFDFKLAGIDDLSKQLEKVLKQTNTKYEPKALELMAKAGKGSVRDTLSVAEMCKAFSNGNITYKAVEECLGLTDEETLSYISKNIALKNGGNILQKVDMLYENGKNMTTLLFDLCDFFKNVLTKKLASDFDLRVPVDVLMHYQEIADICDEKYLLDILKKLSDSMSQIKFTANDRVFVETTLLGLFYNDNLELEMLKQRVQNLESGNVEIKSQNQFVSKQTRMQDVSIENNSQSQNAKAIFGDLIGFVRQNGEMMLFAGLQDVQGVEIKDNVFMLLCKTEDVIKLVEQHKNLLTNYLKEKYNLSGIKAEIYVSEEKRQEEKLFNLLDGKLKIEE